jgi:hypothetical protein
MRGESARNSRQYRKRGKMEYQMRTKKTKERKEYTAIQALALARDEYIRAWKQYMKVISRL